MMSSTDSVFREHINRILNRSLPINNIRELVRKAVSQLGFSDYCLCSIREQEVEVIYSTLPEQLVREYYDRELYLYDLCIEWLLSPDSSPFFQSDINQYILLAPYDSAQSDANKEISLLLQRFQFNDCYNIPVSIDSHLVDRGCFFILNRSMPVSKFRSQVNHYREELEFLAEKLYRYSLKID